MRLRDLYPTKRNTEGALAHRNLRGDVFGEIDKLFSDFFGETSLAPSVNFDYLPKIDVKETQTEFQIRADLPGLSEKDIDVQYSDGTIQIKGERNFENEEKKDDYHRIERSYGKFERRIALPSEIQEDKIEAEYKNGVLNLTLPKSEKAKTSQKKIAVKAS